jgi:hypothetical protein
MPDQHSCRCGAQLFAEASQRPGLRYESAGILKPVADASPYIEIGPEYSGQNNVLAAIKLPNCSRRQIVC